jgi:hypothetical protein
MKIIGSGHDYYDGAGMGVDETIVFLRKEELIQDSPFRLPSSLTLTPNSDQYKLRFFHVLMAGEIIPGLQENLPSKLVRHHTGAHTYEHPEPRLHYTLDHALRAVERLEEARAQAAKYLRRKFPREGIEKHFRTTPTKELSDWMIENRVITGLVFRRSRWQKRHWVSEHIVEANTDRLGAFELYRVVDPATAHMRIANFIGGVLPHGTEVIELSDRSKRNKAGFDDASFRMAKGTKKPRRSRR